MSETSDKIVKAIKGKGRNLESEMSFFGHLEVLRWHLVRSAVAIMVFTGLVFYFYSFIFDTIIMGPRKPGFWSYRMLCKLGEVLDKPGFCIESIPGKIINTEMAGQFTLQINSALLIGLTMGFPYLLFEIWRFIKPALHEKERRAASGFVFYASFLFFTGVLFGYYIISPLSVNFLANYIISPEIENTITIDSYLSSVATLTLATGIVFELPILIYILSTMGIMTPKFMRETRRYAVIAILLLSAIVTPTPDMMTMLVVSLPLFILYEISIMVAAKVDKRRKRKEELLYQANG
ncbi:MAG: twin-arginine translocase subunit TatC [Sphingobacteriaceae bacterium]